MLVPLSWLKEYVEIKLPLKDLMWKMTEAGLTCESTHKMGEDTILDVEVTANRPDWMSILGVAREIAAIQGIKVKEPKIKPLPPLTAKFPIDLIPDFNLFERWTGIVIKGVEIKPSPEWLKTRIISMGHTPINNIIDITNYVMYELGIPMHAFDYDEIYGQVMNLGLSKGGEKFTSVDGVDYILPKNAMIINDSERLIDLAGIKGGLNSGIKQNTKNIFLHVTIDNPVQIRRTSLALGLRSDASAIYERGPDAGATVKSLSRAVNLIMNLAGGEIASKILDIKKKTYEPKKIFLSFTNLENILGIKIPDSEIVRILSALNLMPKKTKQGITCTVPTYRGDIKIEEDLVEEVARLYGYNKFPTTIPKGKVNITKIPYYFNDSILLNVKNLLSSTGFSEAKNLSLISKENIEIFGMDPAKHFRLENPVSLEYEYMRSSLIPQLVGAIKINPVEKLKLFEIDKVYLKTSKKASEIYKASAMSYGNEFRDFKSSIDLILSKLGIFDYSINFDTDKPYFHASHSGTIKQGDVIIGEFGEINPGVLSHMEIDKKVFCFEMDIQNLEKLSTVNMFTPIPVNPAQVEDLSFTLPPKTRIGDVLKLIISSSNLIVNAELKDTFKNSFTFRVWFQDPEKTLTNEEVEKIRITILDAVKRKFGGVIKN